MGAAYFAVLAAATAVYIVLQGTALKIVASAVFLAGAAVFVIMSRVRAQKGYPAFGWLALAAAALCFAGDAAIEFHFLAGMVLFGAGQAGAAVLRGAQTDPAVLADGSEMVWVCGTGLAEGLAPQQGDSGLALYLEIETRKGEQRGR